MELLSIAGCVIGMLLGLAAIIAPARIGKFVGIEPIGGFGLSEVRATYGGLFFAMSIYAFITMSDGALLAVGFGWLGAGAVRLVTMLFQKFDYRNLGGVLMEAAIGTLVAAKAIFSG